MVQWGWVVDSDRFQYAEVEKVDILKAVSKEEAELKKRILLFILVLLSTDRRENITYWLSPLVCISSLVLFL